MSAAEKLTLPIRVAQVRLRPNTTINIRRGEVGRPHFVIDGGIENGRRMLATFVPGGELLDVLPEDMHGYPLTIEKVEVDANGRARLQVSSSGARENVELRFWGGKDKTVEEGALILTPAGEWGAEDPEWQIVSQITAQSKAAATAQLFQRLCALESEVAAPAPIGKIEEVGILEITQGTAGLLMHSYVGRDSQNRIIVLPSAFCLNPTFYPRAGTRVVI
ncbi:MAG: hypothetical protein WC901_03630, partial [Candidatus Margulisiibacteriota bacterium]